MQTTRGMVLGRVVFGGIRMRQITSALAAMLGMALIGSPAYATTAMPSCGASLTPGNADIVNVSSTECSLTLTSPAGGAFLEVSTAPPAGITFDFQVNTGSTLNTADAVQTFTTNFALSFGAGTWTVGVYEPTDPQSDFNFELTDTNHFPIDGSFNTPLPATLPLFAGGLGMLGLFGRRRKQKALNAIAA
jgi:hypothetical protein